MATSGSKQKLLHEVRPNEVAGRDTLARFRSQFRAAVLECLRILESKSIDRVYCDFHDDIVTREKFDGHIRYHFIQVKTKGSQKHQWTRLELFGVPKRTPKLSKGFHAPGGTLLIASADEISRLKNSFVGKLLEHTARFGDSCASATFLTNAYLSDEVEKIAAALAQGNVFETTVRYLSDNYGSTYNIVPAPEMRAAQNCVRKLRFSPANHHLSPDHQEFESKATKAVWTYSEIDLTHTEGTQLAERLIALVEKKSLNKLVHELTEADLDDIAGIGIDDLLSLLPISRGAYKHFLTAGDLDALKNASILQRKLSTAGADEELIEVASRWKVQWDDWFRRYRHTYDGDIRFLQGDINNIFSSWARGEITFLSLHKSAGDLLQKWQTNPLGSSLTIELLLGGILAAMVRSESQ